VTITASTNLNKNEIERMIREAREHEAEDRRRRELVEARNTADQLAYQTEKTLRELGDKVPAGERDSIQRKINDLRQAVQGDDMEKIRRLTEELQNAFHAISQQLYAQQAQSTTSSGGNGRSSSSGEGEVVEGEFREA
jgi:molecular chaperone DnaK